MRRKASNDERWIGRALVLARRGEALASPNPLVGAVLVKKGRVVGEGFHTYAGVKHAEMLALEKAGAKARGATLYINFEPCCHTGRTGPCTKALIAAGVRRVVAAMKDPNSRVAGRGFTQLRRAGIRVKVSPSEQRARRLNEGFAKWIRTGLPLVTLKTAMSFDGKIAGPPSLRRRGSIMWITSPQSRAEVQRLRHASDAILTGIGTVLADDPLLTDRTGRPRRRRLLRVVLDSRLRLPLRSKLVRSARGDVLVFTAADPNSSKARALQRAGVEVVRVRSRGGKPDPRAVFKDLGRREILSVLLECGATLNGAVLEGGVVDKMVLFYAPKTLGPRAVPMVRGGASALQRRPGLRSVTFARFGPDIALEGYLHDVYRNR